MILATCLLNLSALGAGAFAATSPEDTSPFSYTYLEIGASQYDIDNLNDDADFYSLKASLELGMLYLIAGYENQDLKFNDTSSDLFSLGAGLHTSVSPRLDLAADISWLFNDIDRDLSKLDDTNHGYVVRAGPRWMATEWQDGGLELTAEALWVDLDNRIGSADEAFGYGFGARAHFSELVSVGLG